MNQESTESSQGNGKVPGLLLRADGTGQRSGIVLLQEIFGINASMRAIAEDFRSKGYDVFVPDLFWRQEAGVQLDPTSADDRARAVALMEGIDEDAALTDIAASVEILRALDKATGSVAAIGYCLGGRLSYLTAAAGLVDSAVSYYGVAIHKSLDLAEKISVPTLLHIAGDDHLCGPDIQQEIQLALKDNESFTMVTHQGVGHAFARPNSPMWDELAASSANAATLVFLSKTVTPCS